MLVSTGTNRQLSSETPQIGPSQHLLTWVFFTFKRQALQFQLQKLSTKDKLC